MLVKKELETIPAQDYPKLNKKDNEQYAAAASIVNLKRSGEILVIDIFHQETKNIFFRFFSDNKTFLIYTDTKEWIKRHPNNFFGYSSRTSNTEKDLEKVVNFFKKDSEYWYYGYSIQGAMEQFATSINSKRSRQAAERKYALMKDHFNMFPEYPEDLEEYCENNVFNHTYIFVSKIIKSNRQAVCGHCGHKFQTDKSNKPGRKGSCPKCSMNGIFKGDWTRGKFEEKADICIAQKKDNQLLLRWTKVTRKYIDCKYNYEFEDFYRNLYLKTDKGNTIYAYQYQVIMSYGWDWYRKRNDSAYYGQSYVYINNLRRVFGKTYYHVDLKKVLSNVGKISFAKLLDNLKNIPATEYLVKMNLIALAAGISKHDIENNKGFTGVLGVSKQYLKLYQKYNVDLTEHKIIKASKTWVSENNFEKLRSLEPESWYIDSIRKILDTMSFEHFVNYFSKQKELSRKKLNELMTYYNDYISMSESLNVDMSRKSVKYPSNIKTAHDLITVRYNKIKHKIEDENFKQAIEKLYEGMKEYAKGEFCIVFPTSRTEFITEGQSLNHCVGSEGYYKRHIEGSKMIFFIRKVTEPTKPFFTMEIDMKQLRILQLYGFGDCSAPEEVRKFANEFLRKLNPNNQRERIAS